MLGAIKSDCSWFRILHGTVVHRWLCETISQAFAWNCVQKLAHKAISVFLHGAVVQKLPCRTFSEAVAWSCPAKVALQSYFLSFCMELSCRGCFSKLFLKLLYEGVVQKLPFETISLAFVWNCRAKVALCKILFSISRFLRRFLSNGESLGRRLSHVGRNRIRLFMAHDTAWNCRA